MADLAGHTDTLARYLAVAAGGAGGAALRYFLGTTALARAASPFPTATFVINVTGSFALGFFLTLAAERAAPVSPVWRLAFAVGFVGAYTTFSTFEYETLRLVKGRGLGLALLNVTLSVAVGFAAVWGGTALARRLRRAPAPGLSGCERFGGPADETDPAQAPGAPRDIRDSTAGPPRPSAQQRRPW